MSITCLLLSLGLFCIAGQGWEPSTVLLASLLVGIRWLHDSVTLCSQAHPWKHQPRVELGTLATPHYPESARSTSIPNLQGPKLWCCHVVNTILTRAGTPVMTHIWTSQRTLQCSVMYVLTARAHNGLISQELKLQIGYYCCLEELSEQKINF